jgi:acetyl-CoA carboxylase biotin carboxylase subunit
VFSMGGGPGIRVDTAAHSDCIISPYYDSMIAKVIAYGRDRQEAIVRMRRALEMSVVEGVKTTIPMHLKILSDPDFLAGRLSTNFMARFMPKAEGKTGKKDLAEAV